MYLQKSVCELHSCLSNDFKIPSQIHNIKDFSIILKSHDTELKTAKFLCSGLYEYGEVFSFSCIDNVALLFKLCLKKLCGTISLTEKFFLL